MELQLHSLVVCFVGRKMEMTSVIKQDVFFVGRHVEGELFTSTDILSSRMKLDFWRSRAADLSCHT